MQNATTKTFYVHDLDRELRGVVTFDPRHTTVEAVEEAMGKQGPEVYIGDEVPPTETLCGVAEEVFACATREGIPFTYRVLTYVHVRIAAGRIRRLALTAWSGEIEITGDLVAQLSLACEAIGNYWGYTAGPTSASPYGTRTSPGDAEYDADVLLDSARCLMWLLTDIEEISSPSRKKWEEMANTLCRIRGLLTA